MNSSTSFGTAAESDIDFIVELQKKNRESVGFFPRLAIHERIQKQRVILGKLNGEPFGYLLWDRPRNGDVNILQACIQYDARRRLYGAEMYGWALELWKPDFVRLRCAADLESNLFWKALGLTCAAVTVGGIRRGRKINTWHHWLCKPLLLVEVQPAFQLREDCRDAETGFLSKAPNGFTDLGSLGKLAWSNRP